MNEDQLELQKIFLNANAQPVVDATAPRWMQFFQSHRVEFFAFAACFILMVLVFELVRRREIKEKYSFLWFLTGSCLIVLTIKRDWLTVLSNFVGVYYPPTALFLVLGFFVIVILVHFSMVLSKLLTQNQRLAQKIALLETEVHLLKEEESKK